jgi:hypothetical protein
MGIKHLNSLIQRDLNETMELIVFLNQRIAAEESYSFRLGELSHTKPSNENNSRMPVVALIQYRNEMSSISISHKDLAYKLKKLTVALQDFVAACKKQMNPQYESILNGWSIYLQNLEEAKSIEMQAIEKCNAYQLASRELLDNDTEEEKIIQIGDFSISKVDMNLLLRDIQMSVESGVNIRVILGCMALVRKHKRLLPRQRSFSIFDQ